MDDETINVIVVDSMYAKTSTIDCTCIQWMMMMMMIKKHVISNISESIVRPKSLEEEVFCSKTSEFIAQRELGSLVNQ